MPDKELINNKLADLAGYYEELSDLLAEDTNSILSDHLKLHTVERLFQLIVDIAIDINTHIISETNLKAPDDYQSTFITLGENKILPMDFALKIAPSVGLRNLVVHKYGKVDLKKMIEDIKKGIIEYAEFADIIRKFP